MEIFEGMGLGQREQSFQKLSSRNTCVLFRGSKKGVQPDLNECEVEGEAMKSWGHTNQVSCSHEDAGFNLSEMGCHRHLGREGKD